LRFERGGKGAAYVCLNYLGITILHGGTDASWLLDMIGSILRVETASVCCSN
jgi:hypothetical protein